MVSMATSYMILEIGGGGGGFVNNLIYIFMNINENLQK